MKKEKNKKISSEEFDKRFDAGEDMSDFLDKKKAKFVKQVQRINIDFPKEFLSKIDAEARRVGVTRTSLIKIWLSERLLQQST